MNFTVSPGAEAMEPLFAPAWFAAGVVTEPMAAELAREALAAPHYPPRHWRWLAFRDWSEEHEPLTAEQCRAAYELGVNETARDINLGVAIICHVLWQRHCPDDIRRAAARSPFPAVQRATQRR